MDAIDQIRDFNRFYTRALGLLSRSYLTSGHRLAEARVLHDIGDTPTITARELVSNLGMDEAQVSRIIRRFVEAGLVERRPNAADSRQYFLRLTDTGRAALHALSELSRRAISDMAAPVASQLARHLTQAKQLLTKPHETTIRPAQPGDAGWIIGEHGQHYAEHEGYDQTFEALVARILADCLERNDPKHERIFIAEHAGQRVGTISCMKDDAETARLRLFVVRPEARGTGLGQRLHDTCVSFARDAGYKRMVLWTHESHKAACALYAKNGWRLVRSAPGEAYGTKVVDQDWELSLT